MLMLITLLGHLAIQKCVPTNTIPTNINTVLIYQLS